jgi:hypothetical protein
MSKQEDRAQKIAEWLAHLRGWRESGQSLSAYARSHGVAVWGLYHWRGVLTREGHWQEQTSTAARRSAARVQFARVAVTQAARTTPLIVRVVLSNGRHAEIELSEADQFGKILSALDAST